MQLVVALHHHFRKTPCGTVYPYHVFNYSFWQSYLAVFDRVSVFARMSSIDHAEADSLPAPASGPGVDFIPLPDFQGVKGYLKAVLQIKEIANKTVLSDSTPKAFLLRPPSMICDLLWKPLMAKFYPYAVEVVGDPWDALSPGSVKSPLRPLIRRMATRRQKIQCTHASVAAYVTEYGLQKRYPPGNWTTHFSDIILPQKDIVDEQLIAQRTSRIYQDRSERPLRLCSVGSLWHLAKAQDILIKATAESIKRGYNLELVLVGDGSHRSELEELAAQLGISKHVIFAGHLSPGKDVFDQLDEADIYVLPSRQEGLPRSVIEAMARGLPCITSDVAGLPELVEDQWLVKPNDVIQLAGKIQALYDRPDEMVRLIKLNHAKANEYEFSVLQSRRIKMYEKLKEITVQYGKTQK